MDGAQRAMAVACGSFQAGSIVDDNPAPTIADHSSRLELLRHQRYGGPPNAQHLGNRLLDHRHAFLAKGVAGSQQPTAEAGFDGVNAIAGSNLL